MTIKVTVPELGESLVEATVGAWHKKEGDEIAIGDLLVDLETDKIDIEVGAESAGILVSIRQQSGEDVQIGDVLAEIDPDAVQPTAEESTEQSTVTNAEPGDSGENVEETKRKTDEETKARENAPASPVAQRLADEKGVNLARIAGSGPNGRITRQDVENALRQRDHDSPDPKPQIKDRTVTSTSPEKTDSSASERREERVRMSRRRRTIARRLVEAQQTAAMLTTFNEINMDAVISVRERRGEAFRERHGVKLGFMSFFVKGVIGALKAFPRLNAEIDGEEMVLKHYYDIGIAVGAEEGLVVPVIRDADRKSFAIIEQEIRTLAENARDGSLRLDQIRGGTFTITNGGVFGSLLSTPILNPPQVAILGLHRIEERPIAVEGEAVIRPMMYVALSYDHRLIDGREAVQFLARTKELVEDPETLLLEG